MTDTSAQIPAPTRLKELALGLAYAAMLHAATRLGLADALGDEPATLDELAAAVQADPPTLARLLRGLALDGVFAVTDDGRYTHTDLSRLLRSDAPTPMADMVLWAGAAWAWDAWPRLADAVRTGKPVVPDMYGKDFFTYLREDGGADASVFNRAMTQSSGQTSRAVAESLDVSGAKTLVDVGGGQGHLLRTLLERHPHLHGLLFDLPSVVAVADPELREGGSLAARTTIVPGDCLTGVSVEADVYVVKQVLKWDFDSSVRVLEHIRAAARPGARVVVVQNLIDDTPEPRYAAAMDLMLLLNVGGREHTLDEFQRLFERAGLKFAGVTRTRTSLRLIEAVV
ncbi:methyltransferase [Plantactinospora sp. KBS50]|uniref:methyltransferase n=1 Tax=Plantactinospora sp. KBS50 TaxID=2024580 RepID=UPI000BAB07AB|nr:methyltransferase [Plantactinospora sp. KBS50]ASW54612.1 methyltransferase [Plantactinospora sp. KBS50]